MRSFLKISFHTTDSGDSQSLLGGVRLERSELPQPSRNPSAAPVLPSRRLWCMPLTSVVATHPAIREEVPCCAEGATLSFIFIRIHSGGQVFLHKAKSIKDQRMRSVHPAGPSGLRCPAPLIRLPGYPLTGVGLAWSLFRLAPDWREWDAVVGVVVWSSLVGRSILAEGPPGASGMIRDH